MAEKDNGGWGHLATAAVSSVLTLAAVGYASSGEAEPRPSRYLVKGPDGVITELIQPDTPGSADGYSAFIQGGTFQIFPGPGADGDPNAGEQALQDAATQFHKEGCDFGPADIERTRETEVEGRQLYVPKLTLQMDPDCTNKLLVNTPPPAPATDGAVG